MGSEVSSEQHEIDTEQEKLIYSFKTIDEIDKWIDENEENYQDCNELQFKPRDAPEEGGASEPIANYHGSVGAFIWKIQTGIDFPFDLFMHWIKDGKHGHFVNVSHLKHIVGAGDYSATFIGDIIGLEYLFSTWDEIAKELYSEKIIPYEYISKLSDESLKVKAREFNQSVLNNQM